MKSAIRRISILAATLGSLVATPALATSQFSQQDVDPASFITVAAPSRNGETHQLLILEQVSNSRPCWSETPGTPVTVTPLLLQFDFSGICGRSTDSNGYSIRINGEDQRLYSIRIVNKDGDMLLVGAPRERSAQELVIGHVGGITTDFAKITLNPGWRLTRRMYGDRPLGHIYLTYEGDINLPPSPTEPTEPTEPPVVPPPSNGFRDTANDIYSTEIAKAVVIGFITGFEDNTFRPNDALTREQLVSMVLGALSHVPNARLNVPTQANGNPYSDVAASRWSAPKIQFARANNIVSGYEDGSFHPTQPVTRAELMAVLRRTAEYAQRLQGQQPNLQGNRPSQNFSDINGHWANGLITQLSSYCGVASPLNETGNNFYPDAPAHRNYAAAATLRMLNCVSGTPTASR